MDNFIEAMINGHDNTPYRWVSGKCAETCIKCRLNNNSIESMKQWLAEDMPQALGKAVYHDCGDDCECSLIKVC